MKKRMISTALALIMLLTLMPLSAIEADADAYTVRERLVNTAISQIGYAENGDNHTKYGKWYGSDGYSWCAMFVSWCARMSGVPTDVITNFAGCSQGSKWFKDRGRWRDSNYTPQPGDLVFFDWVDEETDKRDGLPEHVGIVEYVSDGVIHTIEGNTTDNYAAPTELESVMRRERQTDDILGYAVPNYSKDAVSALSSQIELCSPVVPTKLSVGRSFSISGTISSSNALKWVCIDIKDANGVCCSSVQVNPNSRSYEIKNADSSIKFGSLRNGNYTYNIEAVDSAYNIRQWSFGFSVCGSEWKLCYDPDGGKEAPSSQYAPCGETLCVSGAEPVREGYKFLGWTDTKTSAAVKYSAGDEIKSAANVTLYALWEACEYTVSFAADNETVAEKTVTVGRKYGALPTAAEKTGYSFSGWYTEQNGGGKKIDAASVVETASDHTLYAFYECRHNFENGICTVCGCRRQFSDVDSTGRHKYYAEAINWAVENGITNGTSADKFSPDSACTRAQVVTFLWRAAGQPETDAAASFRDMVSASSPYYKAILWAAEEGITNGYSDNTFRPDTVCSREQFVTFLWRYMGCPESEMENPFKDVGSGPYYDAIMWAAETGVTNGCGEGKFLPHKLCSRAEVVTFIYRATA